MKMDFNFLLAVFICCLVISSCSQNSIYKAEVIKTNFVGSTPCNPTVNKGFNIALSDTCVYMKWVLDLFHGNGKDSLFTLLISYGDYQPNTMYFLNGGKRLAIKGTWNISMISKNNTPYKILHLSGEKHGPELLFIQLDHHILHLIDNNMKLIKGNESHAFILNRTDTLQKN